uniref:Fibronectin type-III domain-containing protein n=1 Tax=Buteo japonicus TaxID=224669 RepID=A0A8B9Z2K9_9AVES
PVVRMGSDVSINCLSTLGCPWAKFLILLNYSLAEGPLQPLNSSTVRLQLRDFRMPFGTVACFARCSDSERHQLVCGTDVLAGFLEMTVPHSPAVTPRESGLPCQRVHDAGPGSDRGCFLLPSVGTAVAEDAEEEDDEEEEIFPAGLPVPLSALRGGSRYSAWVQASNAPPIHVFPALPAVVPALPLVAGAETTETSPPTTTIRWKRQTLLENVRCEERHKAAGAPAWHVEAWDGTAQHGSRSRHDLRSNTQYVFQVRCRLSPADSPWSAWSTPFLYTTPEAGTLSPDTPEGLCGHVVSSVQKEGRVMRIHLW